MCGLPMTIKAESFVGSPELNHGEQWWPVCDGYVYYNRDGDRRLGVKSHTVREWFKTKEAAHEALASTQQGNRREE